MKLFQKLFPKKTKKESEIVKNLKKFAFLDGLNFFELNHFSQLIHVRNFKSKEIVFKEHYPHAVLYMIIKGNVEIYLSRDKEDIKIVDLKPDSAFGEIGLFTDTNRTASAKCTENTILYAISKQDFQTFINQYPKSGVKIMFNFGKFFSESLINMNQRINHGDVSKH